MFGFNSAQKWVFGVLLASGIAVSSFGGTLTFDKTELSTPSNPGDETVSVEFPYTNASTGVVEIVRFDSNCSACLSAGPKRQLKPGEKGKVEAVFKVGAFTGSIKKTLKVTMRDEQGQLSTTNLILTVNVPVLVSVKPNKMVWQRNGTMETQTTEVKIPWKNPIRITGLTCSRPNFDLRMETVEEGRHYRLHVTPKSLEVAQMGLVKISTDCEFTKFKDHMVFLTVLN